MHPALYALHILAAHGHHKGPVTATEGMWIIGIGIVVLIAGAVRYALSH